jgi:hypothetical protein
MTQQEIVAALRALADRMEQGGKQAAPTLAQARYKAAPPEPAGAETVSGVVAFWDVKVRDNGKPWASLKLKDGKRWACFDQKVIEAADPLMAGQKVTVSLKPWTKKDGSTDVLIAAIRKDQGISDDEIPY